MPVRVGMPTTGSAVGAVAHQLCPQPDLRSPPLPIPQVQPVQDQRPGHPDQHRRSGPSPPNCPVSRARPAPPRMLLTAAIMLPAVNKIPTRVIRTAGAGQRRRHLVVCRWGLTELVGLGHQAAVVAVDALDALQGQQVLDRGIGQPHEGELAQDEQRRQYRGHNGSRGVATWARNPKATRALDTALR
jgi:hypothetical protein